MSVFTRGLFASFALALVIRVLDVVIGGVVRTPDTAGFAEAALALRASLLTPADIFLSRPPVYPVLLALAPSDTVVVFVQAVASALVAPLIGLGTVRHFGRIAGVTAAFAAAIMPSFVEWTPYVLTDVIALTFFAVAIERSSAGLKTGHARDFLSAGVSGMLAFLTRPAYTAGLAALALGPLLRRGGRPRYLGAFALGVLLTLAVPVSRNVAATGSVLIYEGRGWATLWNGTQWNEAGRATAGSDVNVPPDVASLSDSEQTDLYRREFIRTITERPTEFALLSMRKALWYLMPFYPEWSFLHKAVSLMTLGSVYLFAAIGIAAMRRQAFAAFCIAVAASFLVTAMLTIVDYDARYRLPFILALLPLAGAGTAAMLDRVRRPQALASQS